MAVHRYKLQILPRAAFGSDVPVSLTKEEMDRGEDLVAGWWAGRPPSLSLLNGLREMLPVNQTWGDVEEFVSAGDWSSKLGIWKNGETVWAIQLGFSPIQGDWGLLNRFISLAQAADCLLLEPATGEVLEPDALIVRERMANSQAVRFVLDPKAAIVEAARILKTSEPEEL